MEEKWRRRIFYWSDNRVSVVKIEVEFVMDRIVRANFLERLSIQRYSNDSCSNVPACYHR